MKELQDNPFMKTILVPEEYSLILKQLSKEEMIMEREESLKPIRELTQYWKENGLIKDTDINIIVESLRSLAFLWFHKEEIGADRYLEIMEFLIERVCSDVEI